MTDRQTGVNTTGGGRPGVIGVLLLALLAAALEGMGAETHLPMHDITLGGNVVVPSCTVSLDSDTLHFERQEAGEVAMQSQALHLDRCDVEGVSLAFTGATWPGQSGRGVLKHERSRQVSTAWHYRVAPGSQAPGSPAWPLQVAAQAPALMKDTPIPEDNPDGWYFRLDGATYDYSVSRAPQGGEDWIIPLTVSVHCTEAGHEEASDALTGAFSLQLTYR